MKTNPHFSKKLPSILLDGMITFSAILKADIELLQYSSGNVYY